jgi:hypothetical protein
MPNTERMAHFMGNYCLKLYAGLLAVAARTWKEVIDGQGQEDSNVGLAHPGNPHSLRGG